MNRILTICCLLNLVCLLPLKAEDHDPFLTTIRPTDPLTPEEERKTFQVPEGFEVKLFASDPHIHKPLNMAFDAKGRLWITDTVEYPYPAKEGTKGRDSIKILEDTTGDGHADKITVFKDGLNIPIGLYPYKDGVIAFSIPNIWFFRDTDGDGKADKTEKLFGRFGYETDTHGLNNAFRRGFDGWVYACHGFNNDTHVAGADGHQIHLNSGNTYRMRPDGSRIEQFTWGQVNPFGMTFDPLGNQFTADCHSKPVYQLLRNGYYPSFGKPHDGLGFVPPMMDHSHGSTAISGIAFYTGNHFPEEYQGNVFSGNVMTSRINRNSLIYHGSTIIAHEEPDFLSTSDPWFRPVDIQNGADGALYIADFYNRIIGHYEVALDHPGRDRVSGRIWKVVYTGKDSKNSKSAHPKDLSKAGIDELIKAWENPSLTYRNLASDRLSDFYGDKAFSQVKQKFHSTSHPTVRIHALWSLYRMGKVTPGEIRSAANDMHREVRVHAMKVLAESQNWNNEFQDLAIKGLEDSYPFVKRAAADALSLHPSEKNVSPLIKLIENCPEKDNHLMYVARLSLRNQMRDSQIMQQILTKNYNPEQQDILADVCLGLKTNLSGTFLLKYLESGNPEKEEEYINHAVRYLEPAQIDNLVRIVNRKYKDDLSNQNRLMQSVLNAIDQKGLPVSESLAKWGKTLSTSLLNNLNDRSGEWRFTPIANSGKVENPWGVQMRDRHGVPGKVKFLTSLSKAEQLTGSLRSTTFQAPSRFSFYLGGHRGFPDQPAHSLNKVLLRNAQSGQIIKEAFPPRHDLARKIEWDLTSEEGKEVYLEMIDGDTGGGYAWLAVGDFQPEVIQVPDQSPGEWTQKYTDVARIVADLKLKSLIPQIKQKLKDENLELVCKRELAKALMLEPSDSRKSTLIATIGVPEVSQSVQKQILDAVIQNDIDLQKKSLELIAREIPSSMQGLLATSLASDSEGVKTVLELVKKGFLSARTLLQEKIKQQMILSGGKETAAQIEELTEGLPTLNQEIQKLIARKKTDYPRKEHFPQKGKEQFKKHCGICHQVGGEGALVGPQLDGIGLRGFDRVLEDVLDPNRNVDANFRVTSIVTSDGKIYSGLIREETEDRLTMVDSKGKEFFVSKKEIDDRLNSKLSLMPEKLGETISDQEFDDLIAYLLSQKTKKTE